MQQCLIPAEVKETISGFSEGTVRYFLRILWFCFYLMRYQYKLTQYNNPIVKLSNSQLKSGTGVTLRLSVNKIGNDGIVYFQINFYLLKHKL